MEILSEKAIEFWRQNKELSIAPSKNAIIWIAESVDRLRIVLEIHEDATSEEIREAIPLLKEWQARLLDYQGPFWSDDDNGAILEKMSIIQEAGGSWADVTAIYNQATDQDLTRDQVITRLRTWRKNKKHQAYRALQEQKQAGV